MGGVVCIPANAALIDIGPLPVAMRLAGYRPFLPERRGAEGIGRAPAWTRSIAMPELNDRDYYAARAAQARSLAERAADPMIAQIHRRMADSYLELVALSEPKRPTLRVVSG